jgi:uncharacterized protein YndB with AHSA1/START domain
VTDTTETAFRTELTVEVPLERAFKVFTDGFDSWWPRSHHIGGADLQEAIMEPRTGGRWYEKDVDGSECEWGEVLAWEPPGHVALSWHLNPEWQYDPDPGHASRIDVNFTSLGPDSTRVELVHSAIDRHGPDWRQVRDGVSSEGGWPGLLQLFADTLV